ncbi:murein endopeptidase, Metallo peptidase, MEROPS family M74 [Nitrobacter hamburgensis X14]|uniref:Murein endopeptidase, Metallo peptidase, MEROPS family M74 n=1 Tax=Nitrobacter hamburgensis (strain DSM 10229 / NCIMB 13809 / X14) TaxID=323097 RepID=Q1QR20_NITHX|nr:penicillin-insensitive murein endopeptidase [Nitrobacter hamburgensis]ABE61327.1 murein endopeptidase, Metallo peptidase, MEROPS family M74 [Nitrobacter hamburgensis X14]
MNVRAILPLLLVSAIAVLGGPATAPDAFAQTKGTLHPKPLPPLTNPDDPSLAAKQLFGRKMLPTAGPPHVIGFYAKGCIAGAEALPITGPTWQVMRLSRNRNWAHPAMVALLERLSARVHKDAGWPGLLIGDMAQPRGGPMITGHASHQIGLDADVWLTPMPNRLLSRNEREDMSAVMMVRRDRLDIDPHTWTPRHLSVIRAAAREPSVERIFVNAAIKKALCREARGDRSWLSKVRPMYGHDYHFHIRIKCPPGSRQCESQTPPKPTEGCSAHDLAYWFSDAVLHPKPPKVPPKPKPPLTLAQLPSDCRQVLAAPDARP